MYDSKIPLTEHHVGKPKLEPKKPATQINRYIIWAQRSQCRNGFHLKQSAKLTQVYFAQNFR